MPRFTVDELTSSTGGRILQRGRRKTVLGVGTDSRTVGRGELFIPIVGERHDAHAFIPQAVKRGAAAILIQRDRLAAGEAARGEGVWLIAVRDTTRALGDLAAHHRNRFDLPLIAITGSSGKTTTKDMTAAILSTRKHTHKSEGNLNNLFGLPLSLFHLHGRHRASVVELGMNRPGEIRRLAEIARPSAGVITNVGAVHLEFLKTVSGVRDAKAELAEALAVRKDGMLILNGDNPHCLVIAKRFARILKGRILLFGQKKKLDIRASAVRSLGSRGVAFTLFIGGEERPIRLGSPGLHNVSNALAAAAAAWAVGWNADDVAAGLEGFRPMSMRMEIVRIPRGPQVVNDAYNANPDSMAAALRTFASVSNGGRAIAVLGDMLELGRRSGAAHRSIGARIARMAGGKTERIDHLLVIGAQARLLANEAIRRGMPRKRVTVCAAHEEAVRWLRRNAQAGDWILLKGSRGMAMEKVLEGLRRSNAPDSPRKGRDT